MFRRFILCCFVALSAFAATHAASPVPAAHASTTTPPYTTCDPTVYYCGYPCSTTTTYNCGYPCAAPYNCGSYCSVSDPNYPYDCGYPYGGTGYSCPTSSPYPCVYCAYGNSVYPCSYPCASNTATYGCTTCNGSAYYNCGYCGTGGTAYNCAYPCSITPGAAGCNYNCTVTNGVYNCGYGCTTASVYGCYYSCAGAGTVNYCGVPCTTASTNFCGYPCTYSNAAYACEPVIYPCTGVSLPAGCTVIYPTLPGTPPPPTVPTLTGTPVTYAAGYNMVGGPTGMSLAPAEVAYYFSNGAYGALSGRTATACQGYFAYFSTRLNLTVPAGSTGPTQTCHLTAGWNLLGNPFSGSAQLPAGLTGYYWDPGSASYLQLNTIPQGGAVYVYATVAEDVILTYQGVPVTTPTGSTTTTTTTAKVVIISDTTTGPITIHVGDQIQVVFTHPNAEVVSYDSLFFKSVSGGATYPTTCYNPNFCVVSIASTTWTGQAQTIGTTDLTFSPLCYSNSPAGCLFSPHDVKVNVIQ
jgi:hypothetical protein